MNKPLLDPKRGLLAIFLAASGWAFASRAQAAVAEPVRHPDALVVLLRNPWESLDPAIAYDLGSYMILGNVYEPLLAFGGSAEELRPFLSTAVPSAANGLAGADGRRYVFPIRQGVKFHDGSTLTPEDVRYSMLREMLLEEAGESSSMLLRPLLGVDSPVGPGGKWALAPEAVEKAVRVEGNNVVFELRSPFPSFLKMIASWPVVTSKAWAVAHGDWDGTFPKVGAAPPRAGAWLRDHANGTGPFLVESADPRSTEVKLARHEAYWGEPARLPRAIVRSEPSDPLRALMLEHGDADYVYLERGSLDLVEGTPGIDVLDGIPGYSSGETFFFTFDVDASKNRRLGSGKLDGKGVPADFFKDKDVRAGFAYAFDEQAYFKGALAGKGTRATGPVPETLLPSSGLSNPFGYDPTRAEAAFKKAYKGKLWAKGFTVTLSYPRGSGRRQFACEIMKEGIERLSPKIKVELEALPPRDFEKEFHEHRLPLFVSSLAADYPDAHALAFQFLHSKGYYARAQRFADPALDKLEEKAAGEADPAKRRALYVDLQRKAAGEAYQIYTWYPVHFKAVRSWLKGLDRNQGVNGFAFLNLPYFQPLSKE